MFLSRHRIAEILNAGRGDYLKRPLYIGLQRERGNLSEHDPVTDHPEHMGKWKEIKIPITPGDEYLLHSHLTAGKEMKDCVKQIPDGGIQLDPGDTLVVRSRELFKLGSEYGGLIVTPVPLTWLGMSNISTPLDPGFVGYLTITLSNLGPYSLSIFPFNINLPLAYAIIEEVTSGVEPGEGSQPEHGRPQLGGLSDSLAKAPDYYTYRPHVARRARAPQDMASKELWSELHGYAQWHGLPFDTIHAMIDRLARRTAMIEKAVRKKVEPPRRAKRRPQPRH